MNLIERILTPKASTVFTVSLRSKHIKCLGVTLERKLALQARSNRFGKERLHHFEGNVNTNKQPLSRVSYDCGIIHIFRSQEMQLITVPLSGINMYSCTNSQSCTQFCTLSPHTSHHFFLARVLVLLGQNHSPAIGCGPLVVTSQTEQLI